MTWLKKHGMKAWLGFLAGVFLFSVAMIGPCAPRPDTGEDEKVTTLGTLEVTAKLLEIRGEFVDKPMYDYAFVMKYRALEAHRGGFEPDDTIYVGHYNPLKSRATAADERVPDVGGNLKKFRAGDIHRMALEAPIDDYYMGGIINRYFEEHAGPIYWAVWTNSTTAH